jgi:hypothetical protein
VEPLLLTLRRPQNSATRKRFAEAAGELVLIEKVLNPSPVATDFKMAVHGRIVDAADGILYPTKSCNTKYETWLRAEMLDVLRLMIEEGLVRSLVPEMQAKLIADLLKLSCKPLQDSSSSSSSLQDNSSSSSQENGAEQDSSSNGASSDHQHDELVQLYAFSAAYAAFKRFPAARAAAMRAGFLQAAAAFLATVLQQASSSSSSDEAGSVVAADPFERLKAITTAVEAIYFVSLCNTQGEYTLAGAGAGGAAAAAAGESNGAVDVSGVPSLQQLQHQQHLAPLVEAGVAPLLVQAVQQAWQELQDRSSFTYTPPAKKDTAAEQGSEDAEQDKEAETAEQKELRAKAEEAVAAANMTFEENWQLFLKTVYDTELVPSYACAAVQLGCGLLQLLRHEVSSCINASTAGAGSTWLTCQPALLVALAVNDHNCVLWCCVCTDACSFQLCQQCSAGYLYIAGPGSDG